MVQSSTIALGDYLENKDFGLIDVLAVDQNPVSARATSQVFLENVVRWFCFNVLHGS